MIASVNLDVSIVNVTNESVASWRKKGRGMERKQDVEEEWRREGREKNAFLILHPMLIYKKDK